MTRDDIIRMARKAGFPTTKHLSGRYDVAGQAVSRFERFAALVADAEREACAMVCDELVENRPMTGAGKLIAQEAAVAIRARGNT